MTITIRKVNDEKPISAENARSRSQLSKDGGDMKKLHVMVRISADCRTVYWRFVWISSK
jgi:hypothetical protein